LVFFKEREAVFSQEGVKILHLSYLQGLYCIFHFIFSEKFNFEVSIKKKSYFSECCKLVDNKSIPFPNIQRTILSVSRNAQIKIISLNPLFSTFVLPTVHSFKIHFATPTSGKFEQMTLMMWIT